MGLCFHLADYLFLPSQLTGPWTLPKMHTQLSAETDPAAEAYGCRSTLITGWGPLPFRPPINLPARVQRDVSLDLKRGHLISLLQQSLASATSFAFGIPE